MTALIPYVTAGITADWTSYLHAYVRAGADAVEIGLPFSDPMLDGPTIQDAADRALTRGTTTSSVLDELSGISVGVPLIVMTYTNLIVRLGPDAFCARLAAAGVSALIVPDLPVDEAAEVERAAANAGLDYIPLVAPVTTDDRLARIVTHGRGYVYAVSLMGTTGERDRLAESAGHLADRVKRISERPVLLGFGISGPEQAAAAARVGDGVVVASALMRRVLDGATPTDLEHQVAALRSAIDRADRDRGNSGPVTTDQEDSADRTAYPEIPGHRR